MLPLSDLMHAELDPLIDTLMLSEVGIGATIEEAEQAVFEWARAQRRHNTRVRGDRFG